MSAPTPPVTIAEFKATFDRDFSYGSGFDFVRDNDIARALTEAPALFNPALWSTSTIRVAYLYLTAYFMVRNVQAAGGLTPRGAKGGKGIKNRGGGITSQKSVGGVSVGYWTPPEWILKSALLSPLLKNDYGERYLQMLSGKLVGNMFVVNGPTAPDVGTPSLPDIPGITSSND